MELIILLGVGWDEPSFDFLLLITILSTLGLLTGTAALLSHYPWVKPVLLCSCVYMPAALVVLTARGFTPPLVWWLLLPLSLIEIFLASSGLKSTHTNHNCA
jgi:hypothetical protein